MPRAKVKKSTDGKQYVKTVDRSSFDPTRLDLYWRFVAERQRVYVRRVVVGADAPWTTDPVLQDEFITNVYRELDPGTQYCLEHIVDGYDEPEDVVFNVLMYRLMGSVPAVHELVSTKVVNYKQDEFVEVLKRHQAEFDLKVFGDAYRVAAYHDEGGADKVENVSRLFTKFKAGMPETMRRLAAATSTKDAFEVFKGMSGMGEFLAHQVTVDLLYGIVPVLPFGQDEWAQAGPGARAGVWALLRPDVKPSNLLVVMKWLHDEQEAEFAERGITFPYLVDEEGGPQLISLCNIQSTLCEYYKYVRLWSGEKVGAVRRYVPTGERPTGPGVTLTDDQVADLFVPETDNHPSEALTAAVQPPTVEELTPPGDTDLAFYEMSLSTGEPDPSKGTYPIEVHEQVERADDAEARLRGRGPHDLDFVGDAAAPASLETFNFTTPDGRTVNITININVG